MDNEMNETETNEVEETCDGLATDAEAGVYMDQELKEAADFMDREFEGVDELF